MVRSIPVRLFAVAVAAGSLMALPLGGSASAAAGATCAASTNVNKGTTATSHLSKCLPLSVTGGKGLQVVNFKNLQKITGKVTWNGTGTTLFNVTKNTAGPKPNKCPVVGGKKTVYLITSGHITGGTGKAVKAIKVGQVFSESLCYDSKGNVTLYPGSKIVY
jgi:hypothetical protein